MRPGERIDDYTIVAKIGEGGMSVVYVAAHTSDRTRVVVKELKDEHRFDQQLVDRFLREAAILQELRHPHLARVFACLERDGKYYMIQEYLSGGSLADLMRDRAPYSESDALRWCRDALRAMNYAHENGIVHRDLKPSNLMLDDQRQIRVIDFGIARTFGDARLTRTGDGTLGTAEYMSPEQILSPDKIDHLTDVYSMGIVLYELLSGAVPFEGETPFAVQEKITRHTPPPLRQLGRGVVPMNPRSTGIDAKLAKIVFRAIEKRPQRRFGGCAEFALHLDRYVRGESRPSWIRRAWDGSGVPALSSRRVFAGAFFLMMVLLLIWRVSASSVRDIRLVAQAQPAADGKVTFSYQVTNAGNVALSRVTVVDDRATPVFRGGDTDGDSELDVGETWRYEAVVTIAQAHLGADGALVSHAVARADQVASAPYQTTVRLERRPAIAVSSLVNGSRAVQLTGPGPVKYTYEVKNVGNVALTGVKVTDRDDVVPAFDGGDANGNKVLDVGETWQYRATARITRKQLDASNAFVNRAIAMSDQGASPEDRVVVTIAQPMPVRVGGNIAPPQKIYDVRPQYPAAAQAAAVQGVVLVELTIGTDGRVQDARVTRSIPVLDQAALDAVRQWQYQPTIVDGAATPVITTVAVQFRLVPPAADSAGRGGQPTAQPPVAPVRVGGNISQPARTTYVRPEYPPDAQAANVQGVVILEATIDIKGQVRDLRVLRSIPLLDQAAIDAVRQWEYTPTLLNGVAVPVIMTVTVNFTLQ